ncbi:MAG: hypothetical protein WAM39_19210 [Bryobacteraceae bacterium]
MKTVTKWWERSIREEADDYDQRRERPNGDASGSPGQGMDGNWDQMLCDDRPINEVLGIEVADSSPTTPDDKTLSLATPKTKT